MRKKIIGILLVIVVILGVGMVWLKNAHRTAQGLTHEEESIFKHSFRLLEEQTALYVKENFTGISKIEFSPIIFDGGLKFGDPLQVNVVPVVYDQHGNKAYLGRDVGKKPFLSYGLHSGVEFDFGPNNQEIIYLENSKAGGPIDVSGKATLPKEAKISNGNDIDDNIQALVEDGQLRNIEKGRKGRPEAKVVYNLEIQKGDYSKWR
ncbi:hypothetical protein [Streptococcus parasanguinis]|uniref:hypothetical protein n=1 Tax=Streptococcus parasanguinis TaxID=1318 RepID=UPI00319DF8C4